MMVNLPGLMGLAILCALVSGVVISIWTHFGYEYLWAHVGVSFVAAVVGRLGGPAKGAAAPKQRPIYWQDGPWPPPKWERFGSRGSDGTIEWGPKRYPKAKRDD